MKVCHHTFCDRPHGEAGLKGQGLLVFDKEITFQRTE